MSTRSDWCSRGQCPRCRYQACGCSCHDDEQNDENKTPTEETS